MLSVTEWGSLWCDICGSPRLDEFAHEIPARADRPIREYFGRGTCRCDLKLWAQPPLNVALTATRSHMSSGGWAHVLATCLPTDGAVLDPYDMAAVFPLYVRPAPPPEGQMELGL